MSGAGITFTLLSLALAWLLWQGRGGEGQPTWQLRLRTLIPPVLLAALIPSGCASDRFDALRLFANGMTVTERQLQGGRPQSVAAPGCEDYFRAGDSPVFVVGRLRGCVDLVVNDWNGASVDGAIVRLDHRPGAAPVLNLATRAGGGGALVVARDEGGARTFTGAVDLNDGDSLCLRACEAGGRWWTFDDGGTLTAGDDTRSMSLRPGPYGWVEPYGPADRVHRLSQLLCDAPGDSGCDTPALAEGDQPALGFLFQRGGFNGHNWQAMLLDAGARIRRADGAIVRPALTEQVPLAEGGRLHLAILGVRGNALRELRSFSLGHSLAAEPAAARRFTLSLDTPEMVAIGQCSQPLSRLATAPDQVSPEAFALNNFGNRPDGILSSAAAGLPVDRFNLCESTRFAFASPLGDEAQGLGGPILRQIEFSVDRMGIPWLLVMLAFAIALITHAASEKLWRDKPLDSILLSLVQYLLVVRAIIGIEGVFNDAALNWRLIYADAAVAMVALPAILIAVRRRDESALSTLAAVGIFLALALAAVWWWLGRPDFIGMVLTGLAVVSLVARAITLKLPSSSPLVGEDRGGGAAASAAEETPSTGPDISSSAADAAEPPTQPAQSQVRPPDGPKGDCTPTRGEGFFAKLQNLLHRPPTFWPILLAIIVGVRIILGLLGYRERFFGFALSAFYVPLLLIAVAAIVAQAEANPEQRRRFGFWFLAALAAGAGLVAIVINDVGFALVHLPPIAGAALWRLRRWRAQGADRIATALWAAPVAGLAGLYLALWAFVALTPPPGEDAPLDQRVAYAVDDKSIDPNWLRLRAVFAPDQIPAIGNRAAAVQLDQSVLLGELTGTLLGRGWLSPVDLGSFRLQATHLSDYLSASHLMAPFGRLGALALLLVIAAAAGAAVSRRVPAPAAWPNLAGALAIWTLFGAAAYMVLANLLLVPFTGRNIYLLAASSGADLIEGLALFLLARIGLSVARRA